MRRLAAVCLLCSLQAFAESGKINFHVEPALSAALNGPGGGSLWGAGASFKVDLKSFGKGPVAPQLAGYGVSFPDRRLLSSGSAFGGGVGLRIRFIDDQGGYRFHLGGQEGHEGNWLGGVWADGNVTFSGPHGVGFDASAGVELSLVDGLQMGPLVRFQHVAAHSLVGLGLSITVGAPDTTRHNPDPDGDGMVTSADRCPLDAEDKDGFQDEDGCPDEDNDGDGISDAKDACRDSAEDRDGFQDDDGCPEPDNDGDGIPDGKDRCPDQPETVNGQDDDDGCPEKEVKAFIEQHRIAITEKVFFEFNKSRILPRSDPLLEQIADVLKRFPQITKVRVEGHTDDIGTDEVNQKLSEQRAKAVLDRLVKLGVAKERLEAKG